MYQQRGFKIRFKPPGNKMNFKPPGKLMTVILVILFAGLYYYIALPAINIHNPFIWKIMILMNSMTTGKYISPITASQI